jgi:hypothetical protein
MTYFACAHPLEWSNNICKTTTTIILEKEIEHLVDVIGEPRVRIVIVKDVEAETNIVRIILFAAIMKKSKNDFTK